MPASNQRIQAGDSLADVRRALNREQDPVRKAELAREARRLRGHSDLVEGIGIPTQASRRHWREQNPIG